MPARGPYKGRSSYGATTARGYGADWRKTRDTVLGQKGRICHYCGEPANTVDHVIPKDKGGTDDLANLVPACHACNSEKQNRPAETFRPPRQRPAPGPTRQRGWYAPGSRAAASRQWLPEYVFHEGDEAA